MHRSDPDWNDLDNGASRTAADTTQVGRPSKKSGRKWTEERILFQERLLDAIGEALIATDVEGKVLYWNRAAEKLYGWSAEEVEGQTLAEFVVTEDLREQATEIRSALRQGKPWSGEFVVQRKDGTSFPAQVTDMPVLDDHGNVVGLIGVSTDVTERKTTEAALRENEERFRRSFDDAAIGMALVTPDGRFLQVNRSLCEILGYSVEELLGKTFQVITHPDDLEKDLDNLHRMLAGEIRTYQVEKRYIHKEGHAVWALLNVTLVRDEEGEPLYFVSQIQDITERKAMEERLIHEALHASLPDPPNRRLFVDRLSQALRRTRRQHNRVAVLFMDLDSFKVVNDSLGHEVGDLLLTVVAQRLGRCLRPEDTLARFGGDEFTVLIEALDDPTQAVQVAERITDELRRPFITEGRELYVTASIGISLGDARTHDPDALLREADTAMYRAKGEGGAYAVFDPNMYERALGRLEVENDLRRAIERG